MAEIHIPFLEKLLRQELAGPKPPRGKPAKPPQLELLECKKGSDDRIVVRIGLAGDVGQSGQPKALGQRVLPVEFARGTVKKVREIVRRARVALLNDKRALLEGDEVWLEGVSGEPEDGEGPGEVVDDGPAPEPIDDEDATDDELDLEGPADDEDAPPRRATRARRPKAEAHG